MRSSNYKSIQNNYSKYPNEMQSKNKFNFNKNGKPWLTRT